MMIYFCCFRHLRLSIKLHKKKWTIGVVLWLLMKRSVDNLRCNEKFSLDGSKSTRSSESERIRYKRSGGSVGKVADHEGGEGGCVG